MLAYKQSLKTLSRLLRTRMTDAEQQLWSRLRRRQVLDVQFNRQKPVGPFIVDFYAALPRIIIEIDGSQHFEKDHAGKDELRTVYLQEQGFKILRFDNTQVLKEMPTVLEVIFEAVQEQIRGKSPLPPFFKGG
ncbi:MAG: endonuclease domain-containing protein [Deltaproteobacteria bacterium]|nr:endonuclease domain-containing protein [Deltaproteobacteria bacterium]